jgi:hypothetical protein
MRLYMLMFQGLEPEGLSPAELAEQAELQRRYPPLPVEPRFAEMVANLEEAHRRLEREKRKAAIQQADDPRGRPH